MFRPVYSREHKVWFVAKYQSGSYAHANTEEEALRICDFLNEEYEE